MKKVCIIVSLLFSVAGCTLFKRTVKTSDVNFSNDSMAIGRLEKSEFENVNNREQTQFRLDSAEADYTLKFWSKGKVNYMPDRGFEGEFDSITVKGKTRQTNRNIQILNVNDRTNSKLSIDESLKNNIIIGSKKTASSSSYDARWIFLGALLIFVGLSFAFKRWIFR